MAVELIEWCDNLRVASYELRVWNFLCELRVLSILRTASYYWRVMSYFLRVENKNYELQFMALFHLKKKFTKHSEDRKSLLPVYLAKALPILNNFNSKGTFLGNWHTFIPICNCRTVE